LNFFQPLAKYVARALSRYQNGRCIDVRDEDIFIVSYPKSGNTWFKFLIANASDPREEASFLNIDSKIPDIYVNSNATLDSRADPRLLKSHEYFDPRYRKVIYAVRDPRDVFLSYYNHLLKFNRIPPEYPVEKLAERFISGTLDDFGSWGQNVASWYYVRGGDDNFLLLRYEDALTNTANELARICRFLDIPFDEETLAHAITKSSAAQMRRMEYLQLDKLHYAKGSRKDLQFVNRAKAGDWRSDLPLDVGRTIADKWGSLLEDLGYGLE